MKKLLFLLLLLPLLISAQENYEATYKLEFNITISSPDTVSTQSSELLFKVPDLSDLEKGLKTTKAYSDTGMAIILQDSTINSYFNRIKDIKIE